MSGDFTRNTFRPERAYSAVRMQQGRLFTDADWNEEGDIGRRALRRTAGAVIGSSGFPEDNPGFAIMATGANKSPVVLGGEAFVDGIAVDCPKAARLSLKRLSGANAATQWQVDKGTRVAIGDHLVLVGSPLDPGARVSELLPDVDGKQVVRCAAALSVVNTIEVLRHYSIESQPFLPGAQAPTTAGDYLFYLDVWERPIGVIEDPLLRDVAFGGPDTAGRDQIVWQVKSAKLSDLVAVGALAMPASCKSFGPGWTPHGTNVAPGAMAARAEAASAADNPCVLPSTGGYRSLENRLYRVEVHNGGTAPGNNVRIKWSRENAIHRTGYGAIVDKAILIDSIGRDSDSMLKPEDWVEIIDETRLLAGRPGFFARIDDVNGNRVSLAELLDPDSLAPLLDNGEPDIAKLPTRGQLRRWEGGKPQTIAANSWIPLELGVEVFFAVGRYATQDHWLIPARSISANIEWPRDPVAGAPALVPAMGIQHHYCALALGTLAAGAWALTDCRSLFAPLTRQKGFHYLGGDGQEAMPDPLNPATRIQLDGDLLAGYIRGRTPVQGANIRFTVTIGDGRLPNGTKVQVVPTGPNGVAAIKWSVDATTQTQQVLAELLDAGGQPSHLPIVYTANLSRAAETSFDPANVPILAGENTVQGAIEKLAGIQQIGCATRVIVEGSDWVAVLNELKAGENASICFQRGTYETEETVVLKALGHVTLSGSGGGTRIVGKRRECAIHFLECASVTVHDIDISTPDGTGAIENFTRRQGSLTITGCGSVDVCDTSLSCGAGVAAERTCLTVRGREHDPKEPNVPTPSVRILRNRLTAGYSQDGILVTDCLNAVVEENEFAISARPASLPAPKLFETKEWRARLVAMLVKNPASEGLSSRGDVKEIRYGDFTASFESSVPQGEWNNLVAAHPPTAQEQKNAAGHQAYAERIIGLAMGDQDMPPAHKKKMAALVKQSGKPAVDALHQSLKRGLLVDSEVKVERFDEKMSRKGGVVIASGNFRIVFNSPVTQADWNKAMPLMQPKTTVTKGSDLIAHVEDIARRIIVDATFRGKLGSAKAWYDKFVQDLPAFGRQAITFGGKWLGEIAVLRNRVEGFIEGVHIAPSEMREKQSGQAPKDSARNVAVDGNSFFLRLPAQDAYAPFGLFVGNVDTVRIQRNRLDWATPKVGGDPKFKHGIRVWGYIGNFLLIAENRVSVAKIGIKIQPVDPPGDELWNKMMWLAADNLIDDVPPSEAIKGPQWLERRNNRPI